MGLFGKKEIEITAENAIIQIPELKTSEEWIWVEGYKATNKDMQGYNKFQYELNKTYVAEGKIELCKNGFHFCKTLRHTFDFYIPYAKSHRYFKVQALVNKNSWIEDLENNKCIAKEIVFTEEITYSKEMTAALKEYSTICRFVEDTENEEERIKNIKKILSSNLTFLHCDYLVENISFIGPAFARSIMFEMPLFYKDPIKYEILLNYAKALDEGDYSNEFKFNKIEAKVQTLKNNYK